MGSSLRPLVRTYKGKNAINANSFVKFYTTSPYSNKNPAVTQCGAGDRPCGIAQLSAASADGDPIEVAFPGGGGQLHITGTVSPGDFLKSDSSGYGIRTTSSGDAYGAQAHEGGSSGDDIGVDVTVGEKYNATA